MSRHKLTCLLVGAALALSTAVRSQPAHAEESAHKIIAADSIEWKAATASLPAGAQAAVLYGDPAKDGLFAMRLKLPKGYHIPPHTHSKPEVVTVISGTAQLGMGEAADQEKAQRLPTGSFFALQPGMAHYVFTEEETVIQLNSFGPWELNYVRKEDDPRKQTQ
jgi:quercetin dioxygenase-like cupin family protein